jgi:hypothetical protein
MAGLQGHESFSELGQEAQPRIRPGRRTATVQLACRVIVAWAWGQRFALCGVVYRQSSGNYEISQAVFRMHSTKPGDRRNVSPFLRRVAAPLFQGGLPFAPLLHANGGSPFSGSVLSTHRPLFTAHYSPLTIHYSLASHEFADRLKRTQPQDPPSKPEDWAPFA